jgi:hypothetical protein
VARRRACPGGQFELRNAIAATPLVQPLAKRTNASRIASQCRGSGYCTRFASHWWSIAVCGRVGARVRHSGAARPTLANRRFAADAFTMPGLNGPKPANWHVRTAPTDASPSILEALIGVAHSSISAKRVPSTAHAVSAGASMMVSALSSMGATLLSRVRGGDSRGGKARDRIVEAASGLAACRFAAAIVAGGGGDLSVADQLLHCREIGTSCDLGGHRSSAG